MKVSNLCLSGSFAVAIAWLVPGCDQFKGSGGTGEGNGKTATVSWNVASIPARLVRDDGAYEMVAMIDGVEANKRFVASVRVVENQRKSGAASDDEGDREAQAELVKKNEAFLLKTYGFRPGGSHLLIPVKSKLYLKPPVEGGGRSLVGTLESVEAYDKLLELRSRYGVLSKRSTVEAEKEAAEVAASLRQLFGFLVGKEHDLEVEKALLFVKTSPP